MPKAAFLISIASAITAIAGTPAHASVPAQAADAAAKAPRKIFDFCDMCRSLAP